MVENPNIQTTAEWMALPLTVKEVNILEAELDRQYGTSSKFPWPLMHKVLGVARIAAAPGPCPYGQPGNTSWKDGFPGWRCGLLAGHEGDHDRIYQ